MGLVKAAKGAITSTLADQWKEFIYCDALENNVLMQKGSCRVSERSSNTRRETNIISDGSVIAVNEGQFLVVVEDGAIVDFTAQAGEYTYNTGTQPSLFSGNEFDLDAVVEEIKERFAFGGQPGKDQRVYFVNTKEILDQKIGVGNIPFRDGEFNFTISLRGFGSYTFRITNPVTFYRNICANVADEYELGTLSAQMKAEFQKACMPAFARLSDKRIPYDKIVAHVDELCAVLKEQLSVEWDKNRGISICTVSFSSIAPDEQSAKKISQMQESRIYSEPDMLGARMGAAQATALEDAANNPSGAVGGLMGVNMVNAANSAELLNAMNQSKARGGSPDTWKCSCGAENTTNFCGDCGSPKPQESWQCACGTKNSKNFCVNCGSKRPEQGE